MKIIVSTHDGELYNEEIDYAVIRNQDGEFAILKDCTPIISVITQGYVKLLRAKLEYYIVIVNGILEYKDGLINVLTGEAHIGDSYEDAMANLENIRGERLALNKRENVDYTKQEKELRDNIARSKAGSYRDFKG